MGAKVHRETSGVWVVRITGALRKEELDAVQAHWIKAVAPHDEGKILIMVAEDFSGWVGGEVWGDMSFFVTHGNRVGKIAIVGDAKWEDKMLMFAGAGFRQAPVKYFTRNQLAEAQAWLE
jgi:hypothetical protein